VLVASGRRAHPGDVITKTGRAAGAGAPGEQLVQRLAVAAMPSGVAMAGRPKASVRSMPCTTCECRKPLPPAQIRRETPPLRACARWPVGRSASGCACDDLRLVGLKLIFLIVTRAAALLGLSRREVWWKDAEILILRHQLAVAQREQPRAHARLTWPDRAWLALLGAPVPLRPHRTPADAPQCHVAGAAAGA